MNINHIDNQYIVALRRKIHQNPELSGSEYQTQALIIKELKDMGLSPVKVGRTSVIADIIGENKGKCIALRADIDALPINEQTEISFRSKNNGVMHACGHDGHTAMLLGAAKAITNSDISFNGKIRLIFQEAEETFEGAKRVIESGALKDVDAIFGMHGMPLPIGYYHVESGYRMTGCDTIYVEFEGVSGHGSTPHLAKDTIQAAASFVTQLQIVKNKIVSAQEPVVLSVGKFQGGTKANIIANKSQLDISMRYFDKSARQIVHESIYQLAEGIAKIYDISVKINIEASTSSLYNDEKMTELVQRNAVKIFGNDKCLKRPAMMQSEDMAYYLEVVAGSYALLGYANDNKDTSYFPHHEKFNIDENYLTLGALLHVNVALDFLYNGSGSE